MDAIKIDIYLLKYIFFGIKEVKMVVTVVVASIVLGIQY